MIPFSVTVSQDLDVSSFIRTDYSLHSKGEEIDKADSTHQTMLLLNTQLMSPGVFQVFSI